MVRDEGLADLLLGVFLGMGLGFCLIGLACAVLWGVFPDYASGLLTLLNR